MNIPDWRLAAAQKRHATWGKIPSEWLLPQSILDEAKHRLDITGAFVDGLMTDEEREITCSTSTEIVKRIQAFTWTAVQVIRATCKRAAMAHQLNNCLHEIFFDEAIKRAEQIDQHLQETGSIVGPMHGLPVSLKDQFHVKGVETTMGFVGWIGSFEGEQCSSRGSSVQSQLVEELLDAGAILYCKTSLPQTLLLGETINNIIGRTMNPRNQMLSCGGSSGGEGALQALGGSTVGVGTDIGGSVRIPAAFCGIFAIKPSFGRFSYRNVANICPGQTIVPSAIGFMATSLLSLKLIMTSLLSTQPWLRDPDVVPLPWRETHERVCEKESLCFAVFTNDGECTPHPPIVRGITMVVDAVRAAGHEVVVWNPPSHAEATDIHGSSLSADGGAYVWEQLRLSGEPLIPELEDSFDSGPKEAQSIFEYQDNALKRKEYLSRYMQYWNSTSSETESGQAVDAVILPVAPHAAVIPGKYFYYGNVTVPNACKVLRVAGYSEVVDLLDFTSVTIPITKANKNLDTFDDTYKPMNDVDRQNWEAYDADIYDGAPVGLQLMGRRFEEEKMMSIASVVVSALDTFQNKK